jgi:hypothetical protein
MIVIAFAAAVLMAGSAISLALVVISVRREDRRGELPHQAPTAISRHVRNLTGLKVCDPGRACLYPKAISYKEPRAAHCKHPASSPARSSGRSSHQEQAPARPVSNRRSA